MPNYSIEEMVEGARSWGDLLQTCMSERARTERPANRKNADYQMVDYYRRVGRFCFFLHHGVPADGMTADDHALCQRIKEKFGKSAS